MADIQAAVQQSSKTMSMLLSSIAAISLLVGGIGIMNIMLVSVTERTREIGLRKAIGARRWDILAQFLTESVVVSAIGGLIGIMLGWLITFVIGTFSGWSTSITISSVVLSFVFSASIGIIFGIYPARKASLLHPIDALRHE
jgi:macrolide transport system ATP-binding/permease protein